MCQCAGNFGHQVILALIFHSYVMRHAQISSVPWLREGRQGARKSRQHHVRTPSSRRTSVIIKAICQPFDPPFCVVGGLWDCPDAGVEESANVGAPVVGVTPGGNWTLFQAGWVPSAAGVLAPLPFDPVPLDVPIDVAVGIEVSVLVGVLVGVAISLLASMVGWSVDDHDGPFERRA